MKRIPWWTIAAVLVGVWLLYGQFTRFHSEGAAVQAPAPSTYATSEGEEFDPATATLVAPQPVVTTASTERRVGPSDESMEVQREIREQAEATRREQKTRDAYPDIYKN